MKEAVTLVQIEGVPDLGCWLADGRNYEERFYAICQLDILKKVIREKSKMTLKF